MFSIDDFGTNKTSGRLKHFGVIRLNPLNFREFRIARVQSVCVCVCFSYPKNCLAKRFSAAPLPPSTVHRVQNDRWTSNSNASPFCRPEIQNGACQFLLRLSPDTRYSLTELNCKTKNQNYRTHADDVAHRFRCKLRRLNIFTTLSRHLLC